MSTNALASHVARAKRLGRRTPRKVVLAVIVLIASSIVLFGGPRAALVTSFLVLGGGIAWTSRSLAVARKEYKRQGERERRRVFTAGRDMEEIRRLARHLWGGFSASTLVELREFSADPGRRPPARAAALDVIADWHEVAGEKDRARGFRYSAMLADTAPPDGSRMLSFLRDGGQERHFDVLHVSDFCNMGGTTGSNLQELEAQTRAGLRSGLLHNPFATQQTGRPTDPKFNRLLDNDLARYVAPGDRVTCDLMIIRHPRSVELLRDDLPRIEARRVLLVINQTPCRYYGDQGRGEKVWDVPETRRILESWVGEHEWCPISPMVREALLRHHADELGPVRLSTEDWTNIIDLPRWRREERRTPDGTVRIGRHSRDHVSKWPETRELLEAAYPAGRRREVHVLGGARSPERLLGGLPDNWVVRGYDTVPVREFLHGIDVYVYHTSTDLLEAFGRAPLEAMAAGVPTILPPRFERVFGEAGLYAEPEGVRACVEALVDDPVGYERQVEKAWSVLQERFSHDSHLERLRRNGVGTSVIADSYQPNT